jgi:dimethylaniline monooxygenase (N-oxide forming)
MLLIDSDSTVGGVWSKDRLYPNLVAQVNLGLFNYTDTPMSASGVNEKKQVSGRMIHDYLQKYAEDHDLIRRIRFNTHVARVERSSRGWRLFFKDSTDIVDTEKLLVATGVTSIPNMPVYTPKEVSVPVIHSRDLGQAFPELQKSDNKHVIVVGAAKSAYDAVYLLLSMGKKVTWIIRPHGAGPLAILPSELLGFWTSIGVASTRLMTGLSPSILNTKGPLYYFFQRSPLGRLLTGFFWDAVAYLSDLHAGYHKKDHVAMLRPEIGGKRSVSCERIFLCLFSDIDIQRVLGQFRSRCRHLAGLLEHDSQGRRNGFARRALYPRARHPAPQVWKGHQVRLRHYVHWLGRPLCDVRRSVQDRDWPPSEGQGII